MSKDPNVQVAQHIDHVESCVNRTWDLPRKIFWEFYMSVGVPVRGVWDNESPHRGIRIFHGSLRLLIGLVVGACTNTLYSVATPRLYIRLWGSKFEFN